MLNSKFDENLIFDLSIEFADSSKDNMSNHLALVTI